MFPVFLVAHPSVPASNVRELIALAKSGNGLSFGSSGNGGGTHLAGELFNMHAGIKLQHIPYKGSAPALTDLLGGQIDLMITDTSTGVPQVKSGKLRALGYSTTKRSPQLPEVPTLEEAGVKGYDMGYWFAAYAPAG
ncbi:Bug family tripartite tricarboxylate transporter substrate binding protein, partial [Burkholderia sola]|uniref:Bug family tripartite tricarboxylate transporter substrate binding protein n=1 Tax=Burkholderia sola TaxID=2843302 RepID=UPI00338DC554